MRGKNKKNIDKLNIYLKKINSEKNGRNSISDNSSNSINWEYINSLGKTQHKT